MDLRANHALGQAVAALLVPENPVSHFDLGRAFEHEGLGVADPGQRDSAGNPVGKRKRLAEVLAYASDNAPEAGGRLISNLLERMRGGGCFGSGPAALDPELIDRARETFRTEGFLLHDDGRLTPLVLEELAGSDLTDALRVYVARARTGAADAALLEGTSKDLLEATARHVLIETTGAYNAHMPFPGTLMNAMQALGMPLERQRLMDAREQLSPDATERLYEALGLLGLAVNDLRNEDGTGHGRPFLPSMDDASASAAAAAVALVAQVLLARLDGSSGA